MILQYYYFINVKLKSFSALDIGNDEVVPISTLKKHGITRSTINRICELGSGMGRRAKVERPTLERCGNAGKHMATPVLYLVPYIVFGERVALSYRLQCRF